MAEEHDRQRPSIHGEDANACRMQKQVDRFAFVDIALARELNGIDAK